MLKIKAVMTTATVKPRKLDNEGFMKTPEHLNITFQTELDSLTDQQLGRLLGIGATSEEITVIVDAKQQVLDFQKQPEGNTEPTEEQIIARMEELEQQDEYKSFSETELRNIALEDLNDIPF